MNLVSTALPSAALYNGLPTLESAHDFVRTKGLIDRMRKSVGPLFVRAGVNGSWGIYLKHNHWQITDLEIAGEDVKLGQEREYLLRPVPRSSGGYVPITYALEADSFQPLEFSRTVEAYRAHELLLKKTDFLADLKQAMHENGLAQHFGLGIIRENNDPDYRWVEFTAENDRMSVQKYVRHGGVSEKHLIQTSWAFDGSFGRQCNYRCGNCYSPDGAHAGGTQ